MNILSLFFKWKIINAENWVIKLLNSNQICISNIFVSLKFYPSPYRSHIFKPFTKCCPLISCTRFPSSHPIRYGQPVQFVLEPAIQSNEKEDSQRTQLFLASDLKRLGDVSSADGEQDIYFELNQPTFSSVWCLEVADPALRHEMEGTPVKVTAVNCLSHIYNPHPFTMSSD